MPKGCRCWLSLPSPSSRARVWPKNERLACLTGIVSLCILAFSFLGCGALVVNSTITGSLLPQPSSVNFGTVSIGQAASTTVSLLNLSSSPVEVTQFTLTGQSFSVVGPGPLPITIAAGGTYTLSLQFNPAVAGTATGQLIVASNSSASGAPVIGLSGTGMVGTSSAALNALSCSSAAMTGSGTNACTVTLTTPAPSGGLLVNLSSSNAAVTLPSSVTVPTGAMSAGFTAAAASVATAQAVTMTASAGSVSKTFTLQLTAAILAMSINATSVAFGDVEINTPATQPVTMISTGTLPVTINWAKLTGAGFTMLGGEFPATLSPGQESTLNISFDPATLGAATGQLVLSSNSSTNGTAVIGLSGTGTAEPLISVSVAPSSASTTVGGTQQFAAAVTGTTNTAVTWTVSGSGCSGAACGTVSPSGLYTAPAKVPSPPLVIVTATSASDLTKSASAIVTVASSGTTYYLAPASAGGNDSNTGLSPAAPWLTPNHSVSCGDVLTAEAGNYSAGNFQSWEWGTVTCVAGNNVAWVKCATFDACKINSTSGQSGIQIGKSYWGVQGFEVTTGGGNNYAACFTAYGTTAIHHVIFANNVANGCEASGIGLSNTTVNASFDYVAIIGNIAYDAVKSKTECYSGISIYEPIAFDTLAGTHLYIAGNFSFDNVDPAGCAYDGSGIILDTLDGSQENLHSAYNQQVVVNNNITVFNGAAGVAEGGGGNTAATVYVEHNTSYGNYSSALLSKLPCGQIAVNTSPNRGEHTLIYQNLAVVPASTPGCASSQGYAYWISSGDDTDRVYSTYAYSEAGNNVGSYNSAGFSAGPDLVTSINPVFANPVDPGAPACSGTTSVPACMAALIKNFTPTNAAATGYGYQAPSSAAVYDPLFPQWLCDVGLPTGLVTPGCAQATSANSSHSSDGPTVKSSVSSQ